MTRMISKHNSGFSFGGANYEANKNGIVDVPNEAIEAAESHGFVRAPEEEKLDVSKMKRGDLLAYLDKNKVEYDPVSNLTDLRELVTQHHAAKHDLEVEDPNDLDFDRHQTDGTEKHDLKGLHPNKLNP